MFRISLKINHRLRRFLDSRAGVVKGVTLNLRAKIGGCFCFSLLTRGGGGERCHCSGFQNANYSYDTYLFFKKDHNFVNSRTKQGYKLEF